MYTFGMIAMGFVFGYWLTDRINEAEKDRQREANERQLYLVNANIVPLDKLFKRGRAKEDLYR